jgi:hypothetical protein
MTPFEFKNWIEGFIAGMGDEMPTPEQWAAIKTEISKITAPPLNLTLGSPSFQIQYVPQYVAQSYDVTCGIRRARIGGNATSVGSSE